MTERDVFEVRLATAVRGYAGRASSELDPIELAHRIATSEPRRHGFAAGLTWRGIAIQRSTWILLLLATLLTALVAGMLVAGSQPAPKLPAVVPPVLPMDTPPPRVSVSLGPVATCPRGSTPDEPGRVDQARPGLSGTAWLGRMALDRRAGRLVALAGTYDGPVETWTFDVCTNTWTRMHPNQEPPPGSRGLVYDVDSDLTLASDTAGMWAYDLEANTWTEKGRTAPPALAHPLLANLRFYDPVSGRVIDLGSDGDDDTLGLALSGYEVETDAWTPIPAESLAVGPHYEFFAYDASVDRLVAYANAWGPPDGDGNRVFEARVWLLDFRTGTWSGTTAVAPGFSAGWWGMWPGVASDEAAQRTVMMGQGQSAAYDATRDRWETLWMGPSADQPGACGTRPECRQMPGMVFDPVNGRLVVYGGFLPTAAGEIDPDDMLAFDTRTREWTVLLASSEGRPAPSAP